MNKNQNPLMCDPETGVCAVPGSETTTISPVQADAKPVKVIYFTDPICSSCWGIEPQLRKLKLEYGQSLDIEYRMGGLLPDWGYDSGGISKPSDVASHWDEVSEHYDMPIDGDVWLEDPLSSSYPPSIAFKAAQIQDPETAVEYLRVLREMLFLKKKNIAKWEVMEAAATQVGLDTARLRRDFEGEANELFREDLKLAMEFGVRGFPTMFFVDGDVNRELVYGTKPYPFYETAVLKLNPSAEKKEYAKDVTSLFGVFDSLTAKEFSFLSGTRRDDAKGVLDGLVAEGKLEKTVTKNGSLWTKKS